ncbi:fatty acid--CoA ligase [Rhodococcus sp. 1163]|uniref:class I adenylate-forming enzyme family protein n=1 Tax=Rhodococcus sp. 1163 TaxID=1905289 RepID=UPI000A079BEC|nr:class I adenylate-forming enzyme family protein [Rhodococcus sp. 1163]ORI20703.1 fatty acid--CoA ligase [Rhodococcus sp. 1163]
MPVAPVQTQAALAAERLLGPKGAFELVEEDVLGAVMHVMRNRTKSVGALLGESGKFGDREYLVHGDRRITFAEHVALVASLAIELSEHYGIRRGDRIAIAGANTPEWVLTFWASQCLGAVCVGLNSWWVARELDDGIALTRPSLVVADAKRMALLENITLEVPTLSFENDIPRLAAAHVGAQPPHTDVHEDDPAVIVFTSGSTGMPKGVVHSQRNLIAVIDYFSYGEAVAAAVSESSEPVVRAPKRHLLINPLFHISGLHNLAVPRLVTGDTVVTYQGAFDASRVLELIERERITNWGAVPTMASRLLQLTDSERYDLSSLSAFSLGSAPSSAGLLTQLRARFLFARRALVNSYGLTETSTGITLALTDDLERDPTTVGRPIPSVTLEIRDPMGERLPDGDEGEIYVRSPLVMHSYWENPDATADAIAPGRWLRTGDIGVIENGLLRLTTRRSDLIIRGGENVYPVAVEQCLEDHPAVAECCVLGNPHEDLGQEVVAVVVTHPGTTVDEVQLRVFCADRIAYFKIPSRWSVTTDPLPRNATGKLMRKKVVF